MSLAVSHGAMSQTPIVIGGGASSVFMNRERKMINSSYCHLALGDFSSSMILRQAHIDASCHMLP